MPHTSPLTDRPTVRAADTKGGSPEPAEFLSRGPVLLAFHRGTW